MVMCNESDQDSGCRPAATRRAFLAAAAGLLSTAGAIAGTKTADARRRRRGSDRTTNKNQSSATSRGEGGEGGAGGAGGDAEVVCDPNFVNCQEIVPV